MKSAPYRAQFAAYVLAMMADNIEHVISYWVVFQKFHSPALAGFAVLSHWLPFLLFSVAVGWLSWAPTRAKDAAPRRIPVRGLADIMQTIRDIGTQRVLTSMTLLAGLTSFMIGNAYHAQMPGFAGDLGHGDPGVSYSVLLAADAAGALLAGIALEAWGRLKPNPRTAIVLAILWSLSLLAFASVGIYTLAIALLFAAGFFELSFNTMAQALVQINAPADIRGRVVRLFNIAGLGMPAFSGITVGLAVPAIGIHWSLGVSAAVLLAFLFVLDRPAAKDGPT